MTLHRILSGLIIYIRWLSLGKAAGSLAVAFYFTKAAGIQLPLPYWLSLGFASWLVCIVDHFADSYLPGNYSNKKELHQLRDYRNLISSSSLVAVIALIILAFFLSGKIILFGFTICILVVVYIILNQIQNYSKRSFFPREIVIALLFSIGTTGVPLLYSGKHVGHLLLFFLGIFILALTNLIISSCLNFRNDITRGVKSLAVLIGPGKTRLTGILAALLACSIFLFSSFIPDFNAVGLTGIIMSALILAVLIFLPVLPARLSGQMANWILMIPFVMLL